MADSGSSTICFDLKLDCATRWNKAGVRLCGRAAAVSLLQDEENELLATRASIWEIQMKRRAGPASSRFRKTHKDPFRCLLASQCRREQLRIVSADSAFPQLGVRAIW